jgi:uncharacterized protein
METAMKSLTCATLALMLAAGVAAPAALAQPAPPAAESMFRATTLSLSAYGEAKAAPDMATITLGVVTEAATAAEAMAANATRMAQVTAALRRGGIAEKDIQTSGLNLNPQYRYQENRPPLLTGYQASNMVTVTVRDLKRLGQAVDATVGAGANQVHGISFGLENRAAAETAAREAAVRSLMEKAEFYARATGHRIVRLVTLSEGASPGYPVPPPAPVAAMRMEALQKDMTSVSPGELTLRVDITGLYELAR